ncbi:glycosyltransferase family 4 protein [Oryzobacter telluris]|uniref:glycosyltransferase family 4 protein n=1 Tax=Oryzobacter telluris TaxID=3149179 RepID=UPI00370D3F62
MGGTETYVRGLLPRLARRSDLALIALLPSTVSANGLEAEVRRERWGTAPGAVRRLLTTARLLLPGGPRRHARYHDVVHYPFTVALPPSGRTPYVVTLHDVQHRALPEHFSRAERLYRRWAYDRTARRAAAVITDSEFSKDEIVRLLRIPPERIHVIRLGMDPSFTPHYGERDNFVLYPARRWPHKNHARLLEAMERLRVEDPTLTLVLTGGGAPLPDAPHWVEQRGLVSPEELRDLYRRAACLAYPSTYEGFGLPALEAMASGCSVAVSELGALAEVCGDHAETFDPLDPQAIADAIRRAMHMTPSARARAASWSQEFTWERAAEAHAAVFRAVSLR